MTTRRFEISNRTAWVVLALILVASAWLRGQGLDRLGLWIDEDLTALVSRSIRTTGWPLLPSGEAYTRGALYSYVVAGTTGLLGDHESFLRLPSLLFSLGTIVVGFLYARALGGRIAGLVAAVILAASPWELHYARMARMYSLLAFLVLAGVYFVHRGWIEERRGSRIAAAVTAAVAVPVHQLGMIFGLVFLLPHLPLHLSKRTRGMAGSGALVAASLLGIITLGAAKFGVSVFHRAAKAQEAAGLSLVVEQGQGGGSIQLPFLPTLDLNYSRILLLDFFQSGGNAGPSGLIAGVIVSLGLLLATFLARRNLGDALGRAGAVPGAVTLLSWLGFVAMLWLNQFVLAGVFALVFWLRSGRERTWRPLALAGSVAVASFLLGQFVAEGAGAVLSRPFLRLFFALPVPFYRLLAQHDPAMFLTLLVGGAFAFRRSLFQRDDGRFLLASVVLGLLLGMGLFKSPYVIHRYTFYLHPLLVVFYAVSWAGVARWLWVRGARPASIATLGLALALCGQFAPREAWNATHVRYGYGRETLSDPDLTSHFRYDFRGAARYLSENAAPDDVIISKDSVELRAYGIQSNARINDLYSVYAFNAKGEATDWYLAIPILHEQRMLRDRMDSARNAGRRVFIVVPEELPDGPAVHLPGEMETFLEESAPNHEVFRAPDGITRILRFDP